LLLALMEMVKYHGMTKNEFVISGELKSAFSVNFERLKKGNDTDDIMKPFYHLQSDGIWHFKVKQGTDADFAALKEKGGSLSKKALFELIDYAYLDDELFEYFKNDLSREAVKDALFENLEDLSVQFHRWLISLGKSEKTAKSYVAAIGNSISKWAIEANISQQNLISIQSYSKIQGIAEELAEYSVFNERNKVGKQMYSAALNSYKNFLADTYQVQVTQDIETIMQDESIDNTQKATLVNTRLGQGKFRQKLVKRWDGCAVTGYQSSQFLIASHIKPWSKSNDRERLDPYNGFLLLPNLDKAFDLGYISFAESGRIKVSEFIEKPRVLGIVDSMLCKLFWMPGIKNILSITEGMSLRSH